MLSPTGGLVGPGNLALRLDSDNPVALHGTVHDAGGYLNTFHDVGPGYNYLDSKLEILGADSCLSGQLTGITYWVGEAGGDYVSTRVDAVVVKIEKTLTSARDAVASKINDLLGVFSKKADKVVDGAEEVAEDALGVAESIHDACDKAAKAAVESFEKTSANLSRTMNDVAKDKLKSASNFVWN